MDTVEHHADETSGRTRATHWDEVYLSRSPDDVSWFEAEPATSLRLLSAHAPAGAALVDVGAGRSHLAERLVGAGSPDVTVLDVSAAALSAEQEHRPAGVTTVIGDVLEWHPPRRYGGWHDRAVFHFLTQPSDRDRYVEAAARAVAPGGVVVLATFAPDGPTQCSGLPTARWDAPGLAEVFARGFALEHEEREEHLTPVGAVQPLTWVVLRRRADGQGRTGPEPRPSG